MAQGRPRRAREIPRGRPDDRRENHGATRPRRRHDPHVRRNPVGRGLQDHRPVPPRSSTPDCRCSSRHGPRPARLLPDAASSCSKPIAKVSAGIFWPLRTTSSSFARRTARPRHSRRRRSGRDHRPGQHRAPAHGTPRNSVGVLRVERDYLFGDGKIQGFVDNLSRLPHTDHSVLIRSVFGGYVTPQTVSGTTRLCCSR